MSIFIRFLLTDHLFPWLSFISREPVGHSFACIIYLFISVSFCVGGSVLTPPHMSV